MVLAAEAEQATRRILESGSNWAHQDPVNKTQRITNSAGQTIAGIELDPWGGETNRSWNDYLQTHRFTTWERDWTGDESLFRRYHGWWSRFAHPDPYDGSYDFSDPQSFNRYSYVRNDPVNFVDPSGLVRNDCVDENGVPMKCEWSVPVPIRWTPVDDPTTFSFVINSINFRGFTGGGPGGGARGGSGTGNPQDPGKPSMDPGKMSFGTTCAAVPFKVTGIGPGQAPDRTAISRTPRADIPNGGVAIKPGNFGVSGINADNRSVFLGMKFTVDWKTASPAGAPPGIPTEGPFFPVDNIGPRSVRLSPGNMIDVYNYTSMQHALTSTRTVMVTTYIPNNTVGVTCPKAN